MYLCSCGVTIELVKFYKLKEPLTLPYLRVIFMGIFVKKQGGWSNSPRIIPNIKPLWLLKLLGRPFNLAKFHWNRWDGMYHHNLVPRSPTVRRRGDLVKFDLRPGIRACPSSFVHRVLLVTVIIPGEVFAFEGALRNVLRSRGQQKVET